VERVVFHTEETGYCILKVQPDGSRDVVSLLGKAPRVVAGEHFEATGQWEQKAEFGRQFNADELRLTRPDTLDGMERYLGSGLIEGIGKKYAARVVRQFGKDTFDIIENFSARLEEVEGIGKKRDSRVVDEAESHPRDHALSPPARHQCLARHAHPQDVWRAGAGGFGKESVPSRGRHPRCRFQDG
jgi:ATP-dependent exoDNAse (exonuclease V) alpha subunit